MKINRYWPTSYLIVIALISALVAGLPFIMQSEGWDYILRPSNVYCAMAWKERDARSLIVSFATLTICVLPMGFIGYVYATIYKQTAKIFQATSDALSKDTANMSAPCNTQEDSKTGKKGMKGFSGNGATPDLERGILIMAPENVPKSARRTSQQQNVSIGTKMSSTRLLVVDRVFLSAGDLKATSMAQAADLKPERRARPVKTEEQLLQDALLKQSIIIVSAFVLGWAPYLICECGFCKMKLPNN
ncbi:hypothetical protein BC830DRAFT_1111797 [Chytriomyces sp. MP71]|nr:hypothetical protein BC830DRAFT_1111797 [Chytriomyces sp. MP71]